MPSNKGIETHSQTKWEMCKGDWKHPQDLEVALSLWEFKVLRIFNFL
jgi:hypothetical protein